MDKQPVIAIFDIGKTNKKLLLFNENYNIVYEKAEKFDETQDEDGFPTEDIRLIKTFIHDSFSRIINHSEWEIKAINFASYGASFVHLDTEGHELTPIYNYLKPYPSPLQQAFNQSHGNPEKIALETASPTMGNLNSGMQIYRIKYHYPDLYDKITISLHFPQYLSYLLTSKLATDITSIGCHTSLWNFSKDNYHDWVDAECINLKFAPILANSHTFEINYEGYSIKTGIGIHDSSAALIPYLHHFRVPFLLISTGTWCISLNPFNSSSLTYEELQADCLSYLSFQGKQVKASRLFSGHEHDLEVKRLGKHYQKDTDYFQTILFDQKIIQNFEKINIPERDRDHKILIKSVFALRNLNDYSSYEIAYHRLILDLVNLQVYSIGLINQTNIKQLIVDGGFSLNPLFMNLMAQAFPHLEVYSASMPQATALGAALAIHHSWNENPIPSNLIALRKYSAFQAIPS